jgi:outer membrane protein assembly factor BamD
MHLRRWSRAATLGSALLVTACSPTFRIGRYRTSPQLWAAAVREFNRKHWDNAIQAFDRLTLDLPARDSLLPQAYFYLGKAHQNKGEFLLAAQSFTRLAEAFPDDTLGDDAMYESARSYARLWRKPSLDPTHGYTAISTYRSMIELYPDSPRRPEGERAIRRLEEWFATKDYDTGMHYFRRKAYDSAIIYFKDVVKNHPETVKARDANLRLVESYRAIRYREDAAEVCTALGQKYPSDRDVRGLCGAPVTANRPTP